MTDGDKIAAAIFTASMCSGKNVDHATFLQTYEDFLNQMEQREREKKKTPPITKELVESVRQKTRRRR